MVATRREENMSSRDDEVNFKDVLTMIVMGIMALALVLGVILGAIWGFKSFNRSQRVADAKTTAQTALIKANNDVTVTEINIKNQAQRVQVAQQQAQIRFEEAKGIKAAQDEISKTLTPLYVQMEQVRALEEIAKDGKNATVVYIPSGAGGVPLVSGTPGLPAVTVPEK